jgi:hypothetical protein
VMAVLWVAFAGSALAQEPEMTFFITSEGPGDGANLGTGRPISASLR